ncbi:fungal specific transcription factor, putative [Talaromyces stipitatus ATCC 10500]|uniref:Fungal specific transcription factor, putative n=1 Tax=Talaromyces stipitatus (strain ATCC 10500 / CBS 375.48 / QM 6759 / NRRL 1006) TaxID=441959 RepID=B8MCD3_TALSN|nr:fungal specific transcription factor, putative [Talaromyces stipitatus ATCC 10500]EED18579.1 fungal specific transcription factor, putative [Talaromyces stipitatus ATCC 10500]
MLTKSLYESRWAPQNNTPQSTTPSPSSAQELARFLKIVSRLKWKLPFLSEGYRLATARFDMSPSDVAYAEIMFKIDFHEYYALLERAIVHLLAVWGITVPNPRYKVTDPQNSTKGNVSSDRWSATHRYHATVLETLERESCPLYPALGSGSVRDQLRRAKQLRNRWKTADSPEEDEQHRSAAFSGTSGNNNVPLESYDLEGMITSIFSGLEQGHALAQQHVSRDNPEMEIETSVAGDTRADWDFIVDAMDWEAQEIIRHVLLKKYTRESGELGWQTTAKEALLTLKRQALNRGSEGNTPKSLGNNECKRRKLKCSGGDVCKRCVSNEISCVYAAHPRPPASEENQSADNYSSSWKLKSLESRMSAMQKQLDLMSTEIGILRRRSLPFQRHAQATIEPNKPTDLRWATRAPVSPSYVGPTSSEFGLNVPDDDVPDIDETENSEIVQPSSSNSPYVPPILPEEGRKRASISTSNPLLSLGEADALRLVDVYEEAVGLMYPVVDLKSIREYIIDYYSQHSNDSANDICPPQNGNEVWWFSARDTEVLKIVLALALISESPGQSELGNILASSVEDTFAQTRTQVPEVDMKELIILALVALYHSLRDDDILAWRTIGLATRGAIQMGLHRCDTWLRTGGIFPGDLERSWAINLFWCIYVFDKEFSFETGLPFSMRDSDMDPTLPVPTEYHTYLECMISYCRVGGKIMDLMIGWGSTARAVGSDNESFLNFQIQQWQESIPSEFRLEDLRSDRTPTMRDSRLATPRILLHLRANQMRILVYKQNLLSAESIRNNLTGANIAVTNARNTIHTLSKLRYVSAIYFQRPQPFDRFLFSALATLFLAMFHSPDYFVNVCRDSFSEALNALKRSSIRGRHSRRLRKVMKNLKRLGINRPPSGNRQSHPSAAPPPPPRHANQHHATNVIESETMSNAQAAGMDPSVYSVPPSLVNETTPDDYSDLTNFFEFAGDFFMDPQPSLRGDVDQANVMSNELTHQFQNSIDMFQGGDETLTRLMMGLL